MTSEPVTVACARCGRPRRQAARWPDGIICGPCHKAAQRHVGCCAACGRRRVLPGQHGQARLCAPCFGIPGYICATCNADDEVLWGVRECLRCALRRRLGALLDDGNGRPAAFLAPLVDALCAAKNPASGHEWLRSSAVRDRLRALARGDLPLTHEAFSALPSSTGSSPKRIARPSPPTSPGTTTGALPGNWPIASSNPPPGAPPGSRSVLPSPSWPGSGSGAPPWRAATSTTSTHGSPTDRAPGSPPGDSSPSPSNGASASPCASPSPSTASQTPCPTTSASR